VTPEPKTKQLIRPMSPTWWLEKPAYTNFMIRDITSVFIAAYCIFLMVVLCKAMHSDAASFQAFYASWGSGFSKALHLIALIFAAYHSITFFNLTPRVIVVFKGEEKVPESFIALAHYGLWAVVSLIIIVIGLWV
jgi:fumarate reductase subunit C